mmetsp:Transcript_21645/g.61309  ORF Transcript_21645/g.61309 Transcript_21645/m.61309 type:complete len:273 (+) Transcript_21645:252-1070(+)
MQRRHHIGTLMPAAACILRFQQALAPARESLHKTNVILIRVGDEIALVSGAVDEAKTFGSNMGGKVTAPTLPKSANCRKIRLEDPTDHSVFVLLWAEPLCADGSTNVEHRFSGQAKQARGQPKLTRSRRGRQAHAREEAAHLAPVWPALVELVLPEGIRWHNWQAMLDGLTEEAQVGAEVRNLMLVCEVNLLVDTARLHHEAFSALQDLVQHSVVSNPTIPDHENLTEYRQIVEHARHTDEDLAPKDFGGLPQGEGHHCEGRMWMPRENALR